MRGGIQGWGGWGGGGSPDKTEGVETFFEKNRLGGLLFGTK